MSTKGQPRVRIGQHGTGVQLVAPPVETPWTQDTTIFTTMEKEPQKYTDLAFVGPHGDGIDVGLAYPAEKGPGGLAWFDPMPLTEAGATPNLAYNHANFAVLDTDVSAVRAENELWELRRHWQVGVAAVDGGGYHERVALTFMDSIGQVSQTTAEWSFRSVDSPDDLWPSIAVFNPTEVQQYACIVTQEVGAYYAFIAWTDPLPTGFIDLQAFAGMHLLGGGDPQPIDIGPDVIVPGRRMSVVNVGNDRVLCCYVGAIGHVKAVLVTRSGTTMSVGTSVEVFAPAEGFKALRVGHVAVEHPTAADGVATTYVCTVPYLETYGRVGYRRLNVGASIQVGPVFERGA